MSTVLILDTRAGNLFSLRAAIERLGYQTETLSAPPPGTEDYSALVIPGQGRFGTVMENIEPAGWGDYLRDFKATGKPILGICVGMQILFESSDEDPGAKGLGWYKGHIQKLEFPKQPMVGWATLESPVMPDWAMYFVNSYALVDTELAIAKTRYGQTFTAAVADHNVIGVQFHPEKSGPLGEQLIGKALSGILHKQIQQAGSIRFGELTEDRLLPRVIVCLDVDKGRVVKGTNFKELRDMGDPIELALRYQEQGADELVFLDISATRERRNTALDLVTEIARHLSIPFTVGGGLKNLEDVKAFLDAGADKVALNSTAVLKPEVVDATAKAYGSQCVMVAVDVNDESEGDTENLVCYISGGHKKVDLDFNAWTLEAAERGAGELMLNAMHKDGTGTGFDNDLTLDVSRRLPIQVIASGGAKTPEHFVESFKQGVDACLAAGMFHTNQYQVQDVKQAVVEAGIAMRLTESTTSGKES